MRKCVKTWISTITCMLLTMLIIGCWTLKGVEASDETAYTFSDYRESADQDEEGNWIDVPEKEGYVFAGWYDAEGNAAPSTATTGDYEAKFVSEDVLSLKLQLRSSDTTDTEPVSSATQKADLRLITSVDTLDYQSVGFKVIGTKATKTYESDKVYSTIKGYTYVDDNLTEQTYTPAKAFCEESNYFMSHVIQNAKNTVDSHDASDQFGKTLTVIPQWTTLDGTLVYGTERSFEINDGIEEYVAEIDEINGTSEDTDHVWYTSLADAVTAANASAKEDAVQIGLLRDFSLSARVITTRNISIQNVTDNDITISRGDAVTDYTMIRHEPAEAGTLTIGTNGVGTSKIIFDGEDMTGHEQVALNNRDKGTMYLNENVIVKNMKVNTYDEDGTHGAGGFNNMGVAYVSATFTNCTGYGGGAIYSTGATLDFDGTIQSCGAYQGGAINVASTCAFNMTGGSITSCTADTYGGAIYGGGNAVVTVIDGSITSCLAAEEGGAIRAATVMFNGGTIDSCKAVKGAGIRIYTGTIDGTIKNCISTGADQTTSFGGAVYAIGGKVTMTSANITGCQAYYGGGIYVLDGTLNVNGGTIDNCDSLGTTTTDSRGGAIYTLSTVNMTAGTIKNGDAARGAGIFVDSASGVLNMTGGTITNCISTSEGGGIYGTGSGTVNFNGGAISSCSAINGGAIQLVKGTLKGTITDCSSTNIGGAAYVKGTVEMDGATIQNCTSKNGGAMGTNTALTITSGTIDNCTATSSGGAIYAEAGTVGLKGGTITGCTATTTGGAIYEKIGEITMSGGEISSCSSPNGGAVYEAAGSFSMSAGTIDKCEATNGAGGAVNLAGGAAFALSGGTIQNCTATGTGGAVHGATNGTITVTGGKIYKCSSTGSNGGAIRIITGEIGGGIIDSCTAPAGYGGGVIFDGASASVSFTDGIIQNCSAAYGGGACISFNNAALEMTMSGGTIQDCTATTAGGGIAFEEKSIFTMTGGTIQNCTAAKQGGGIYEAKGTSTIKLQGGTIYNCDSTATDTTNGRGGGVYSYSPVILTAGTVEDCNAYRGSGIYIGAATGSLTMSGGTINNCDSVENGGGVYGEGSSCIYFNGGTISSCDASAGGGAIRMTSGTVAGNISNCTAKNGGAVLVDGTSASVTMSAGTISGCTATSNGGAFYVQKETTLIMSGGTISGCTGSNVGGGIKLMSGADFTMTGGAISENVSKNLGGAIHAEGSNEITLTAGEISNNTSNHTDGGAAVNGIQASGCGIETTITIGSEFNMGANSIRLTGVKTRTEDPVLVINGDSLTNHSAEKPLYIAMSDGQQSYVQIQCDSETAATAVCAIIDSVDGKAIFEANGSLINAVVPEYTISCMSYNVLGSGKEDEGYLAPAVRAAKIYEYLNASGMDLIGIQEAQENGGSYDWQTGFQESVLADTYNMIRIKDQGVTSNIGNGLIILYDAERFTLLDSGVKDYDNDDDTRCYQWAKFTDTKTNKTVFMTNTHWSIVKVDDVTDVETSEARRKVQAQELLDFWNDNVGDSMLFATGDYNCSPGADDFEIVCGDIYQPADVAGLLPIKAYIDHIFVNPNFVKVQNYAPKSITFTLDDDTTTYKYSDHSPKVLISAIK